jgi:hypothetical protein
MLEQANSEKIVLDAGESCRAFGMMGAHIVKGAVLMVNECSGHFCRTSR